VLLTGTTKGTVPFHHGTAKKLEKKLALAVELAVELKVASGLS
jgi:hypothetical protein